MKLFLFCFSILDNNQFVTLPSQAFEHLEFLENLWVQRRDVIIHLNFCDPVMSDLRVFKWNKFRAQCFYERWTASNYPHQRQMLLKYFENEFLALFTQVILGSFTSQILGINQIQFGSSIHEKFFF